MPRDVLVTRSQQGTYRQGPLLLERQASTQMNDHAGENVKCCSSGGGRGLAMSPRVVKTSASFRCAGKAAWKLLPQLGEDKGLMSSLRSSLCRRAITHVCHSPVPSSLCREIGVH